MPLKSDVKFWIISDGMEYPSLSPVDKWDIRSCMEYCKFHNLCNMFDYIPSAEPPCWAKTESFDVQRWRMFENEDGLNFFFNREEYEASLKIAACKIRRNIVYICLLVKHLLNLNM